MRKLFISVKTVVFDFIIKLVPFRYSLLAGLPNREIHYPEQGVFACQPDGRQAVNTSCISIELFTQRRGDATTLLMDVNTPGRVKNRLIVLP